MYMVIFRTADGKPGYQQAEGAQDAVASVERLRNEDGVDSVRIFRMEEVAFEYKVHYSVQLSDVVESAPAVSPGAGPAAEPSTDELAWDDPAEGADDASPPFDQMAVDPAGAPRWDEATEPAAIEDPQAPSDDADSAGAQEPVASEADPRRGLFGR